MNASVVPQTTVPTLVTPGGDPGPMAFEDARTAVRRVLVPVDLTPATSHQLAVARQVADSLQLPLLMVHVIEPVRSLVTAHATVSHVETERRYRAEAHLEREAGASGGAAKPEALVAYGEPAEEIAKVAADRDVGLIVMGLHSSPLLGPRMGSVTYRVLCLAHRLVLALPPLPVAGSGAARHETRMEGDVRVEK